jgi:hypothetical protein
MIKIFCDNCNADLTFSNGGYDHCLRLSDRKYGPNGPWVLDYLMMPLLDKDMIFCGFGCLEKWMEKRKNNDQMQ